MDSLSPTADLAHLGAAPRRARSVRTTLSCALGNGLEMYDFTVYSFFAVIIAHNFFPAQSPMASLMMSLATFGVGFLLRPIGAVVIGRAADRHGRKFALSLTIGLMTLGTAMIAFAPTYGQAGLLGTCMLVLGRLTQGFSAGGEIGTASVFLMESADPARRCRNLAWQGASQAYAALLGAGMGWVVTHSLEPAQLESWGWRIPFLVGLLIGPVGWYIRRYLPETQTAAAAEKAKGRPELGNLILAIGLHAGSTIGLYLFIFYMPAFLVSTLHYPPSSAMAVPMAASACGALLAPLLAYFPDRFRLRKKLLYCTMAAANVISAITFYVLTHTQSVPLAMAMMVVQALPSCVGGAAGVALVTESFAKEHRAFGCAVSYSLGVTLFGGFSPMIATWLIHTLQTPLAPLYYFYGGEVVSLVCLLLIKEHIGRE